MSTLTLEEAQAQRVVIGLKDVAGPKGVRRDIDDLLLNDADAFNVFALAFSDLQKEEESSNYMSYFQLSGIHGMPKSLWDDVSIATKNKSNISSSGYCAHGTPSFGPWHRPYLALLEQTIYSKMLEKAKSYPDKADQEKYLAAANRWRLPYWDYHRPRGGKVTFPGVVNGGTTGTNFHVNLPLIFTAPNIMVHEPGNKGLTPHSNPFLSYNFPKTSSQDRIPDIQWETVGKWARNPDGVSLLNRDVTDRYGGDQIELDSTLNQAREGEVQYVLNMMGATEYRRFTVVADQGFTTGSSASGSLEGIHGRYHGHIGGNGHMGQVAVAAFDPVFWFHHCQIDRWFAIWQAIHPNSWYSPAHKAFQEATLLPFRTSKEPEEFWKPDQTRDWETFGYTYADVESGSPDAVLNAFRAKYGWGCRKRRNDAFGECPDDMKPLDLQEAQVFDFSASRPEHAIIRPLLVPTAEFSLLAADSTVATQQVETEAVAAETVSHEQTADPKERAFVNISEEVVEDPGSSAVEESNVDRQWFVDVLVERLALNGSFGTYIFLGDFDDNAAIYKFQPTWAGYMYVFAAPVEMCDNCGAQEEQAYLVSDTVPITPMLLDYEKTGELASLGAVDVVEFLKSKLKWRVLKANGEKVDPRDIPSLKIGISSTAVDIDTGVKTIEEYPQVIEDIIGRSS